METEYNPDNANEITLLDVNLSQGDKVLFYDGFEKYFGYDNLKIENGNIYSLVEKGTDNQIVMLEDGSYSFYVDTSINNGIWIVKDNDPSLGDTIVQITALPDWLYIDDAVIFAWVWSDTNSGQWVETIYIDEETLAFIVPENVTNFLLVRCIAGTTTPNWNETGDVIGRIYNQTTDHTLLEDVYSYKCTWTSYNPS